MGFFLIIVSAFLLAGCRHAESVSEFDTDRVYRLDLLQPRERETSREAVLRIMGPADAVSADNLALAYHWRTYSTAGPLLSTGWPLPRRDYGDTGRLRLHILLLEFEPGGLLVKKGIWSAVETGAALPSTEAVLEQWHAPGSPSTSPAVPSRGP